MTDLAAMTAAQLIERSVQLSALTKLIDAQQAELRPALEAAVLALEEQAGQPGMTLKHPTGTAVVIDFASPWILATEASPFDGRGQNLRLEEGASVARICEIEGCERSVHGYGWCLMHYKRHWRQGSLPPAPTFEERFWAKVDKDGPDGCWLWTGAVSKYDYGRMVVPGRPRTAPSEAAHRISYTMLVGPIPDGLVIDHLCQVHRCVNPAHMEPVTNAENSLRGSRNARKTHCLRGHPFEGPNLIRVSPTERACRTCVRENARRNWARRSAS